MNKTAVLNVRVPKELLQDIDKVMEKRKFTSRSEVIRFYLREYAQEIKQKNTEANNK
ncbi:ribbon-helix-helix domain-containing protein [Candidatus Woesearchaeota archaeon]|nr:ribbon-helix-helix domain-containing protein [Candidatus Woesearchaeota archaeon]MCF7901549.1 ribbon-helix-helix domain-containing protein [Candidatus Woesearchaeota archaeon]